MADSGKRLKSRQELIDYCLRRLGHPVIEINIDDDQLQDRLDDALQFFAEYHFDGTEMVFIKYKITEQDIQNGYIDMRHSDSNPDRFMSSPGSSGQNESVQTPVETGQTSDVKIEDTIISINGIWHISQSALGMFDIRYQYALNDLYTFGTINLINYTLTQTYLSLIQQMLTPEKAVRFSRKSHRLYIDTKWGRDIREGSYIIIEAYRIIDPTVNVDVYNDMLLKRYLTALIKRQWASNLSKFKNIQMPGGIVFNGDELYQQAENEIKEIEDSMQSKFELPPGFITG